MKKFIADKDYFSTIEAGKLLMISREAVLKRIKTGSLQAKKIGRNYAISHEVMEATMGSKLTGTQEKEINAAVKKAMKEYRGAFERLAKE